MCKPRAYKQQFTITGLDWFALIWPFTEVEPDILAKSRTKATDLFTNTAAILNKFDLRSIIGCPGGMSTIRLYFRALFGTFFLKVFLE